MKVGKIKLYTMTKRNKKVSYNSIPTIKEDWGLDSRNNLPYSGESVQAFIKKAINSKIGYRKTSEKREPDGYFHTRSFADEENYRLWESDPSSHHSLLLLDEILPDTHEQGASYVLNLETKSNQNLIVATDDTVRLRLKFTSQIYNPITKTTEDTGESGVLTIERKTKGSNTWNRVASQPIMSVSKDSTEYQDIDISNYLELGDQQIRVVVRGDSSNESSRYISFFSVIKTSLSLKFANQWELPITGDTLYLQYYIQGAVAKTLHIRVYGISGSSYRELLFPLGATIYNETPKVVRLIDTERDEVKVLEHGVHKVEAWLTVDGSDISTDKVYSQIMVESDTSDMTPFIIVNDLKTSVNNYTENVLFKYSIYNPKKNGTDLVFKFNNYNDTTTYVSYPVNNVPNNTVTAFTNTFEIESDLKSINAYLNILHNNINLIAPIGVTIDNSNNFAFTKGADFILNPKLRSNNESDVNTIINSVNNSIILSSFNNFGFTNDGWVEDEQGTKCLRVPVGRTVEIQYEAFSDFIQNFQNASLTIELDFKTKYVSDPSLPVIKMCSYTDDIPVGFELRPTEAVFMTKNKKVRRDQDVMFQEGVRTHMAINIINNIADSGVNLIRIFINGVVNREIDYLTNDSFLNIIGGVATSQGVRIGSQGANIDVYGIRVYKKQLSVADIMQNYIATLPTVEAKMAFKAANDIIGDNGTISYSKALDKYNCLVWTGHVPSYINKASSSKGGTLQIHIKGDTTHSGVINNMSIKGQGSSSRGYWKWNHQYGFNSDSQFISEDGNTTIKGAYRLTTDVPAAKKLVAKLNWASSMQSHKLGETNAYNDLWKRIVGNNDITKTSGFENCRVAITQKPFLYFVKESPNDEPTFYGIITFGPAKADKPTFGYDKNHFPDFLMLEGSDNGKPLTECRVPWMEDEVSYSENEEAYIYNGELSWDYDMGNQESLPYFIRAFNFVFQHSIRIAPHEGNYTALKTDNTLSKFTQYWITEDEGDHKKFDLFRWDYITNSWVSASTAKEAGRYIRFNINEQCGNIASGINWRSINDLFINARIRLVRENLSNYFNLTDLFFSMMEMKKVGASDNRCKNIYPYLDPVTHTIRWYQDDVDTILLTDNVGRKNKPYYVEEHDKDSLGNYYWNGESNNLFNLVEAAYPDELRTMMKTILTTMAEISGSPSKFMQEYFFKVQEYIPAIAYNETAKLLYEDAAKAVLRGAYANATPPISQSLGDQLQAERQWWKMREIYISSYASYGEFDVRGNNSLMFRSVKPDYEEHAAYNFNLVPAMWLYVQGGVGQTMFYGTGKVRPKRVKAGELFKLGEITADGNTDIFINGANYYKSFGNFASVSLGETFQLLGESLEKFEVINDSGTVDFKPQRLIVNCPTLKVFRLENVPYLQGALDLSGSNFLESININNSNINAVLLPSTPTLKDIVLSGTIKELILHDLPNLINDHLVLSNWGALETIDIAGCPKLDSLAVITQAIKSKAPLHKVVAPNINWVISDLEVFNKLLESDSTLSGKITLRGINVDINTKLKMISKWGDIDDVNNKLHINYPIANISDVTLEYDRYYREPGKYNIKVTTNVGNNVAKVEWNISNNKWATINRTTGELIVTSVGLYSDVPVPEATVTCVLTKSSGERLTKSTRVCFYEKKAAIGDIVYADGSFSDKLDKDKTPIGVCFYINPENEKDRRMMTFEDMPTTPWGIWPANSALDATGIYNLKLADSPSYNCYQVPNIAYPASADNVSVKTGYYGGAHTDSQGFTVFNPPHVFSTPFTMRVPFKEGLYNYSHGDVIPTGLYETLLILKHRDKILSDSGINLPIPAANNVASEMTNLGDLLIQITSSKGQQYTQLYYPIISTCHAYEPKVKNGEKLADKFKAGNWWAPSIIEVCRFMHYIYLGANSSQSEDFTTVLDNNMIKFTSGWFASTSQYAAPFYLQFNRIAGIINILGHKLHSAFTKAVANF